MKIPLLGGPDDGELVEVPEPPARSLTLILVESEFDRKYMDEVRDLTGDLPPPQFTPNYIEAEYELRLRPDHSPVYWFVREQPHGRVR